MDTNALDIPDPAEEGRCTADATRDSLELTEEPCHYPQTKMPEVTASIVIGFLKQSAS
jgi:hypothetical protein